MPVDSAGEAPASPRDLVRQAARCAVRDQMSDTYLRDIDAMWNDEGFSRYTHEPTAVGGQRVTHFQGYLDEVNWADRQQVASALRVFESALRPLFKDDYLDRSRADDQIERLRKLFAKDGYVLDDQGHITGGPHEALSEPLLSVLEDPTAIRDHLQRISNGLDNDDPAQVIGSTKELVESTAKLVLRARGEDFDVHDTVPQLVNKAQRSLALHPSQAKPGPDGADATKKILGGAMSVTSGLTELRNRGYGTGHGGERARTGLAIRHARMAVNAARLWCEMVLDTLQDPDAPWRKSQDL